MQLCSNVLKRSLYPPQFSSNIKLEVSEVSRLKDKWGFFSTTAEEQYRPCSWA